VDGLRQHLLPGSGLTKQQDCRVGLRDLRDFLKHAQESRRLAHDSLRRSDLCGILQIGIFSLKPVLRIFISAIAFSSFSCSRFRATAMGEYFTTSVNRANQIVRPWAGIAEGRESNSADDAPADAKRDAQMRMHSGPSEIFRLANRFGRKIIGRVLYREHFAGAKSGNEPVKLRRKADLAGRVDPFDSG